MSSSSRFDALPPASHCVLQLCAPEQEHETWLRTADHWGTPLSVAEYVDRERLLSTEPFAEGHLTWCLAPQSDYDGHDFLSSCETYPRTLLVSRAPGEVEEVPALSVCSVWTPSACRGRGYARRLVGLLHDEALKRGAHGSFLYSDIGHFYEGARSSSGSAYHVQSPYEVFMPLTTSLTSPLTTVPLTKDDMAELAQQDCSLMKQELAKSAVKPVVAVAIDGRELRWLMRRSEHQAAQPSCPLPPGNVVPRTFGARLEGSTTLAYAAWNYRFDKARLDVLRLRCSTVDELKALLSAACREGLRNGCTHLLAYNIPDTLMDDDLGQYRRQMDDSWPALAWYGPGETPHWCYNEKYPWM